MLDSLALIREHKKGMKAVTLDRGEQMAFAHAALSIRCDESDATTPVTDEQLLRPRRIKDH